MSPSDADGGAPADPACSLRFLVAQFVGGLYDGTAHLSDGRLEGRKIATAVIGAAWNEVHKSLDLDHGCLKEAEEVKRCAASVLGKKVGIGMLKQELGARGRIDLSSAVARLNSGRKFAAHPGCLAERVREALLSPKLARDARRSADGSTSGSGIPLVDDKAVAPFGGAPAEQDLGAQTNGQASSVSPGGACRVERFDIASQGGDGYESKERWADICSSCGSADDVVNYEARTKDSIDATDLSWEVSATQKEMKFAKQLATVFVMECGTGVLPGFTWKPLPFFAQEGATSALDSTPQEVAKLTEDEGNSEDNAEYDEEDEAVVMFTDSVIDALCASPIDKNRAKRALQLFVQARVTCGEIRASALEEGMQIIRLCTGSLKLATAETAKEDLIDVAKEQTGGH